MIPEKTKAQAIAKLRHCVSEEAIAEELDLPVKLIRQWKSLLDPKDLIAVEANIHAVEQVLNGELVGEDNEAKLKETLELTAIDIAKEASNPMTLQDPMAAKAIQLCADAVSKLYTTIIMKGGTGTPNDSPVGRLSTFQQLLKD